MIGVHLETDKLSAAEYGLFETDCDGNIQTTKINQGINTAANFTECFSNFTFCTLLTVRIGGAYIYIHTYRCLHMISLHIHQNDEQAGSVAAVIMYGSQTLTFIMELLHRQNTLQIQHKVCNI